MRLAEKRERGRWRWNEVGIGRVDVVGVRLFSIEIICCL